MSGARIAVALFGPPGRGSFNESGQAGWRRLVDAGHEVALHWIPGPEAPQRAQALRALCNSGLDLLVAHGGQGDAPVHAIAAEFPHTMFAITQGHRAAANVACYEVLQEQSAFLAGVLAGLASRSRVVAHLSGEKVLPGLKGRAAFAHGVRSAAPDCRFVTTFCGQQHDPERAGRAARALQDEGADLCFAMIDGGRDGVSAVCRDGRMRQIGNVLDWVARDPAVFVASAIADSGQGVTRAVHDFLAGIFQPGTVQRTGLEAPEVVRLALSPEMAAWARPIEDWAQRVLDGTVAVAETYDGPELSPLPVS